MDTTDKDTWSEEMCIKLIHAYRQHPVLYDPKDPYFYKRYAKISAWNSVGESLQRTPRECKHKMGILLSSFRRQKSKFRKGNMTVSKWFGYQHLKFLLLINKDEHSMYRMLSNDSEEDARSIISTEDCDEGQPGEGGTHENNDIETLIVTEDDFIKMENESDMDDDNDGNSEKEPSMLRNILNEPTQAQLTQDKEIPEPSKHMRMVSKKAILKVQEINAFTKFVNSKLRKYSSKTITSIQREICEILFKADLELYKRYNN